MKFRSLYQSIALIFALLLLMFGALCAWIELMAAQDQQDEVVQRLNRGLADHIAGHWALFGQNGIDQQAVKQLFHMLMVVNPSIELYLLAEDGSILSYDAPPEKIRLQRVAPAPIRGFLAGEDLPIYGENPRHPQRRGIFSASALERDGHATVYLYILLSGDAYHRLNDQAWLGHVIRSAWLTGTSGLMLTLSAGLWLFYRITRRLNRLTRAVGKFEQADFSGSIQFDPSLKSGADEIGRLAAAFRSMAGRIETQLCQIKRQDELRREMVANVSHDLRTPLTSMQGYLETMQRKFDQLSADEHRRYLEVAVRQSHHVAHLAQQMFELARLELKEVQPHFEYFPVQELLQDAAQKFELAAKAKQVQIQVDYLENFPHVYADIAMIDRVLLNLIDNALRHTPDGGLIRLGLEIDSERQLLIRVEDSGSGIASEYLPGLFERDSPLRRLPRQHAGGGLGLLISKRILELHGSTIQAINARGSGALFSFRLPTAAPV